MMQADRNKLYDLASALDNKPRIRLSKRVDLPAELSDSLLEKLRMQGKTSNLYVLFTEAELAALADAVRELVSKDGSTL